MRTIRTSPLGYRCGLNQIGSQLTTGTVSLSHNTKQNGVEKSEQTLLTTFAEQPQAHNVCTTGNRSSRQAL